MHSAIILVDLGSIPDSVIVVVVYKHLVIINIKNISIIKTHSAYYF